MAYAPNRNRALAKIHIAKVQLKLTDEIYRAMLREIVGVESAADLDNLGLARVLDHLKSLGFKGKASYPGRPRNMEDQDRGPLLRKIEALLTVGRKSWSYADGIARHVCGVDRVSWCRPDELHRIAGVLSSNARRYSWGEDREKGGPAA